MLKMQVLTKFVYENFALFFIVMANSSILLSNTFAWMTYSLVYKSQKVSVPVGNYGQDYAWVCLFMTFLLPLFTVLGMSVVNLWHEWIVDKLQRSFHLIWLFTISFFCMRTIVGGAQYHIAVAVSLLLLPYIFVHPNLYVSHFHLLTVSFFHFIFSFVVLGANNGKFIFDNNRVDYFWLDPTNVNVHNGVTVCLLLVLMSMMVFFLSGVWIQILYVKCSLSLKVVVGSAIFISGLILTFFPMSLLLPGNNTATGLLTSLRVIQFCSITATNTIIIDVHRDDIFRHISKSCIVVVIGLIMQSLLHEAGSLTQLLRCLGVMFAIIVLDPILSTKI
jgi:hypothetical protein